MISIDDHPPSDPSSSHHQDHLKIKININDDYYKASVSVSDSDLKYSDDADHNNLDDFLNNPLPNFSIRDHVFGLRSKDVACNWPFSSKSLQICLKNGVKNLLPPFQPLVLLKDNNLENRLASNQETVNGFDGKPIKDRSKPFISDASKSNRELTVSSNSSGSKENYKESNTKSKEKPSSLSSQKRSRLVMKLNSGVEQVELDNIVATPNTFIVSETMASKVCPVCKIFSSSSNTTLNAHIDQCLTGEASMKWTDNSKVVIVKHRIKPRKTRLMSDIYETAPHCTIEELDRRNGTSWATNSSFPAQEFRFQEEKEEKDEKEEKEEPRLMKTMNLEVADNEGDVYIDTDGTKVRILSVPKAGSLDNNGGRKLLKGVKGFKIVINKKKNNLFKAKHHQKSLKLGSNPGKLCSSKPSNSCRPPENVDEQIRSGEKEDVTMAEDCRKEEGVREPMKAPTAGLTIVRPPWACSKRTDLGRKFGGKQRKKLELRKDFLVESNNKSLENSSQIRKKTRTSSPLTKPNSKLLSQENDDSSGSQDSYPSQQHSDGPEIRPMNNKFSSLKKNLSFSAPKTNLKRKFSAFKKSKSFSSKGTRNEITISPERSFTSKSSNEDRSSDGIENDIEDALRDVESVRNEIDPYFSDEDRATPASRMIDNDTDLKDLSNSFDPEFSKLVNDQICTTNRAPDGKNIFGNDIEDHTEEDIEKNNQDYNFQEVDPIPIPGPPGSFLPSPGGDMVSDEIQPIQPIRVPPIENPHNLDTIDRDSMSNSPVSTVSNPSMARSDSRSSEKAGFSGLTIEPTFKKSFPTGAGSGGDWRPVDNIEKGPSPTSFKNDQPCCCSRKETASSYSAVSNYNQDSGFSRKQPPTESNKNPNLNFRSESMLFLNNYPNSQPPDSMIFPMTTIKKSPSAAGLTVKLPIYSDCDSAASPSKPVLRLMGKNLTVVNTDDDVSSSPSPQFRPPMNQMIQGSFSHGYPNRPVIFNRYQNGSESNHFHGQPPVNMRSFMADRYGPNLGPMVPPARSFNGYNGLNSQMPCGRNMYNNGSSSSNPIKEVIIIDDSPENEADDYMRNDHFLRRNQFYDQYPYGGGGSGGPAVFRGGGGGFQTSSSMMHMGSSSLSSSSSPSNSTSHLRSSSAYYPTSYHP